MAKLTETSFRALCEADTLQLLRAYALDPQPAGKNHKVRCPFHAGGNERSPSLTIWPDGGWYCFSCRTAGRGGVDFIWQADKLPSWTEAGEKAASILGITLDYDGRAASDGPTHADLRAALVRAAAHYTAQLITAPEALAYADRRGLSAPIRQRWSLGYACADHVRDCGAPESHLLLAGVLRRREDGSTYDPLHARLIIPLHDQSGRIVGFTGRSLSDNGPKYINTAETPLYSKGRLLFGLHRARELLRHTPGPLQILEGQLKALACLEAGIPAVAPGGTAFGPEQATQALGLTRSLRLSFDRDPAGIKATRDAAAALRQYEAIVEVSTLNLPPGAPDGARDPDDLLAANLPITYTHSTLAAWALANLPTQPAGSAAWAAEITGPVLDLIDTHPNPAVRHCEIAEIQHLTQLPPAALRRRQPIPPPAAQTAAIAVLDDPPPLTPGRLLCALALQAPLAAELPWSALVPWTDLHPKLVAALWNIALARQRALARRVSLLAILADPAGSCFIPSAPLLDEIRLWAVAPLPQIPDSELWAELCRRLVADEHLRRTQQGLV